MDQQKNAIRCHYDVLSVTRDADAATIKKAHRKLALKYHPDKNVNDEKAADQFRLVQQAYECLSDPAERVWYDQHREAILKGWLGAGGGDNNVSILFDVVPYHVASCYNGHGDDEGGFFAVYRMVFQQIYEGEERGWVSEGNIEAWPLTFLAKDFGNSETSWDLVASFYKGWESFTSCLKFAWADVYDTKEAPNRRVRRAMEEENKKARRNAKRERINDIVSLAKFCKRRDPRVKAQRERVEKQEIRRQAEKEEEAKRKKAQASEAREAWKLEAGQVMAEFEEEDRIAGRVRLADLDDGYDYGGGKRGKKNKKKNRNTFEDDDEEEEEENADNTEEIGTEDKAAVPASNNEPETEATSEAITDKEGKVNDDNVEENGMKDEATEPESTDRPETEATLEGFNEASEQNDGVVDEFEDDYGSEEETESEPEPDVWQCECCRKEFKSEGQVINHMKSKKHKEAYKKFQAKKKKEDADIMEELIEELALDP